MAVVGEGLFLDSVKDEVAEEDPVAVLKDYFKFRYTENDHEYLKCRNRRKMMYQVPVISPWPPPLVRNRRPRGRYKDHRHREKDRYGSDRSHHRSLVSSHERYNDWSPPRYHRSYRYRSRSPGSPQHSPPTSHLSHSYDHDQFRSSQEDELLSSQEQHQRKKEEEHQREKAEYQREKVEHQREKEEQPLAERPQEREEEKGTESKPAPAISNYFDSLMLNMRESPEKLTDSDFQDILINASSGSSKPVLPLKRQKKEKKEPAKKQQPQEKASTTETSTAKRKVQPDGLLVSHGNTKSVTASILRDGLSANKTMALPQRNKKKRTRVISNISDEEDDEIIDPVQVNNDTMQLSTRLRQEATDSAHGGIGGKVKVEEGQPGLKSAFYNQPEAFTVHINLKHVNLNSKTESFNHTETQPVSPTVSPSTAPCMYSSAVTLDDSNKHVVLRLSKPVESETDVLSAKKSHKSKKKKKSKEH
ncbi:PREDICTED: pre-mRNA-splicing factor cwc25-like [Amphimedon queenslandica]|uniref:Uncharacterized protein n=1 Tax=Amphimedon queenslandica TaxID=400682 RepID=A0A1X7UTL4_AMPQE|nr:PREDICTED: pre-mRNA-splicing factor cwc25-like [Amphimedon queenslandica]|eukprot:XP_019852464.1 PREDICTED: pre-mRNA-splicing factor cwc25-like [Amphimedon queenslandica]